MIVAARSGKLADPKERKHKQRLRPFSRLCELGGDERGFTLIFFAVALPLMLGVVGLAVDVGRLYTLDTQLANVADAAALAAASQLDRNDGALQRARDAANALTNEASFSDTSHVELSFRFAATLPELQNSPIFTLSDPSGAAAVYVEVRTAHRSLTASFLEFVGAQAAPIQRRATAESQYYACDVTPLMMCHRDPAGFTASATRGRQYMLRNSAAMTDGTLVTLDAPGDVAGRFTPQRLASNRPAFCYTDTIIYRAGVTARQFDDAVNVRFDRYQQANGPIAPELAAFPPAPSVIQGQRYKSCLSPPNAADVNPPYHLPRDSAFRRVTDDTRYDQGSGDWKATLAYGASGSNVALALDEYIYWNHADKTAAFQSRLRASTSRFEIYLKELGLDQLTEPNLVSTRPGALSATLPTGGPRAGSYASLSETPTPRCYSGREPANEARRRVVYIAIVDCRNFASNASAAVLSRFVGKFFLVEPSNAGVIFVEFLNLVKPVSDDGKLRHIVQLVDTG